MFVGPMSFELLASFVLITGPTPKEGDEERYFHLYPQIRLIGVQLELCDGKESWFDELRRISNGARRYLEFLENHAAWLGPDNLPREVGLRIMRAKDRCQTLYLYEEASQYGNSIHHIRMNLRTLLNAIGPEAFYSGRIPSFIPEEDLP